MEGRALAALDRAIKTPPSSHGERTSMEAYSRRTEGDHLWRAGNRETAGLVRVLLNCRHAFHESYFEQQLCHVGS
jgi:hypothetical protein